MKKTITLSMLLVTTFLLSNNFLNSNPVGAPAGNTGSVADGQTCGVSGCHSTTPTPTTSSLSSDIPTTGYVPGNTYTISVNIAGTGRKGFQVSPQSLNGTLLGTIASGTDNKIVGTKYVTHTSAKTSNPGSWTFSWTAPTKGTGEVKFYGAFVNNRPNVTTQTLTVQEALGTNVNNNLNALKFNVFPNPTIDLINLNFYNHSTSKIEINLISIDGKTNINLFDKVLNEGNHQLDLDLKNIEKGIYFVEIKNNKSVDYKRIVLQ